MFLPRTYTLNVQKINCETPRERTGKKEVFNVKSEVSIVKMRLICAGELLVNTDATVDMCLF